MEIEERATCMTCGGNKTINLTLVDNDTETKQVLGCISCDGKGWVTKEERATQETERKIWCKCPPEIHDSHGIHYHPDNSGKTYLGLEVVKHHYSCRKCGLVVQIG